MRETARGERTIAKRLSVAEIVEDAVGVPTAGRSVLYRWMRQHHDELLAKWAGLRIDWIATCARFAAAGLTDRRGKPPTPGTAQKTWQRVRHDVARARSQADQTGKQPAASPPLEPTEDPPPRFRLAVPRGMEPPTDPAAKPDSSSKGKT